MRAVTEMSFSYWVYIRAAYCQQLPSQVSPQTKSLKQAPVLCVVTCLGQAPSSQKGTSAGNFLHACLRIHAFAGESTSTRCNSGPSDRWHVLTLMTLPLRVWELRVGLASMRNVGNTGVPPPPPQRPIKGPTINARPLLVRVISSKPVASGCSSRKRRGDLSAREWVQGR